MSVAHLIQIFLHGISLLRVAEALQTDFVFNGFIGKDLRLIRDASIDVSRVLSLTKDSELSTGRAFYPKPLKMKNKSFSTTFIFSIAPARGYSPGHGFAFLLTPYANLRGALPAQYLGLLNTTADKSESDHLFAVEFDTCDNIELQDINDNHVGVDLNSLRSTNSTPAGYWIGSHNEGSLDKMIFGNPGKILLPWAESYRVLKGIAAGLLYLHEEWEQKVLHRDVKASNVLLDAEFNGRLGDFGLARLYDHGNHPHTTHVVGTLGYLAPELVRTGKATTSTDVFSFGSLLLEVACGRRPIEPNKSADELVLVDWVWELWETGKLLNAVDPKLLGQYVVEEMEKVLALGLLCSYTEARLRPDMRQVVQVLEDGLISGADLLDNVIPMSRQLVGDGDYFVMRMSLVAHKMVLTFIAMEKRERRILHHASIAENPTLLDSVDHLSEKNKEDVRKILSSKNLFYDMLGGTCKQGLDSIRK
eukprot:Gb_17365 [translate_table: standard]